MVRTMTSESEADRHYAPSVRLCDMARPSNGSCGFHLTRSKWDPYPWVSGVESGSAAEAAGLQSGDCVLEVNGDDVLGQRIGEVASRVRARGDRVSMLLWNAGSDPQCSPESLCCGPMPSNLQRLSSCMSSILAVLECPVCLDTIPPPAHQCGNGHLICVQCRVKTERCPVCRVRFCRARSLLADQVFNSLTEAFGLKEEAEETRPAKLKERLFGTKKSKQAPQTPELKVSLISSPTNKFLTRILGKSSSVDNLSSNPVNLSAMPRHLSAVIDSEFSSNLKAKSLSTSEICQPVGSRPVSRSPSINSAHQKMGSGLLDVSLFLGSKRPASYHGSCESLQGRIDSDFGSDNTELRCCPCEQHCPSTIKAQEVLQHIQECHEGPLVHYFKPKLSLSLPLALEDTAVVAVTYEGNLFFFKVFHLPPESETSGPGDTLVWLWMLGSKVEADNYYLVLNLKGHGDQGKELHFRCKALSLCSTSWAEISSARRGICLTASKLIENFAMELEAGISIKMEAEVKDRTDGHYMP
ncbi:uncharacterized protein [Periplaneta americana]|uniref:uncharacterized protein n=1 Tax=Periplaneta americana TaxID=6978 RepID=UPI0037E7AC7B